jgi:hypothetical protein
MAASADERVSALTGRMLRKKRYIKVNFSDQSLELA